MLLRQPKVLRDNFSLKPQNKLPLYATQHRRVGTYWKIDVLVFFIKVVITIRNVWEANKRIQRKQPTISIDVLKGIARGGSRDFEKIGRFMPATVIGWRRKF